MCDYIDLETRIKNHIFAGFKTVSFMYLVAEQNKNGKLHFHILLSIRNFVDYSYTLRSNLII